MDLVSDEKISSDDDNDQWKSFDEDQDDVTIVKNNGWANFETNAVTVQNDDDDWADFASNTNPSIDISNDKQSEKINKDDDVFGDYEEVQQINPKPSLSINCLNTEQIESVISACFPLEPSIDTDDFIPFELPTLTTFKDQTKQLPCFKHSLHLWNALSKLTNDPLGIQYQWRKSHTERLFHQALDVHERFHSKTTSVTKEISTTISDVNGENQSLPQDVDPLFDWKQSGLENPLTDTDSSSSVTNSSNTEDNILDVNKTLDLDYYVPPLQTSTLNKEEQTNSPIIIHRNNSPISQQQSTPIKTIDLYPGSTTVLNEDIKPVVNSLQNFSFINPKALMFPTQITHESTI